MNRVDIIIQRFHEIQDIELQIMMKRTDILGLMVGMTDDELETLFRRQPFLKEFR